MNFEVSKVNYVDGGVNPDYIKVKMRNVDCEEIRDDFELKFGDTKTFIEDKNLKSKKLKEHIEKELQNLKRRKNSEPQRYISTENDVQEKPENISL